MKLSSPGLTGGSKRVPAKLVLEVLSRGAVTQLIENNGFPLKTCGNDERGKRLYSQTLSEKSFSEPSVAKGSEGILKEWKKR
jgi:hypothetical protein